MATIKDVARRAGVGVSTVSRVLNNSGYYDPETARAVHAAVAELGYRRNIHWTRLARNSSETICFLLGNRDTLNSMHTRMLVSAEYALKQSGFDLVFSTFHYQEKCPSDRLELPRVLAQRGFVDGVILAGLNYQNLLDALQLLGIRYVALGNTLLASPEKLASNCVTYDDVAGVSEGVEYLLRLGHKRIAFVGNTRMEWFARRYHGFCDAMKDAGLEPAGITAPWPVPYTEYGQLAAAELLRMKNPPTAIFAANDELAAGVWKECVKRGVAIPAAISLAGFGDREEFSIIEPALTSVAVYPQQLGSTLAQMMVDTLRNPDQPVASVRLPCRLLERASCSPPPMAQKA